MKAIIAMLLLGAALVTLTPNASACEVTDPTGTTYTCVDQYEYASGDCDTGGYESSGTSASTWIPGVGSAGAGVNSFCYNDPNWGINYAGSSASAGAYVEPLQTGAGVTYYDYDGSFGSYCDTYVYTFGAAGNNYQSLGCPAGPLPI